MRPPQPIDRAKSCDIRFFRMLLHLYPRAFRMEYGGEMTQLFQDRLRDEPGGRRRLWKQAFADTIVSVLRERREQMKTSTIAMALAAVASGLTIAWIDSRPNWDDTGITAGTVLIVAAVFGAAQPRTSWFWALAVGAWIPALAIVRTGNYGALLALVFAFMGAYIGAALRKAFAPPAAPTGDRP